MLDSPLPAAVDCRGVERRLLHRERWTTFRDPRFYEKVSECHELAHRVCNTGVFRDHPSSGRAMFVAGV